MKNCLSEWEETMILIEKILEYATVERMAKRTVLGQRMKIRVSRPMRVRDVAEAVGEKTDAVFRWLRSGVIPPEKIQKRLRAWCEKQLRE